MCRGSGGRPRQVALLAAARTRADDEPVLGGGRPEAGSLRVVEDGQDAVGHDASVVRSSALAPGGGALVTSATSAPGTWAVDVPRIWRTTSAGGAPYRSSHTRGR